MNVELLRYYMFHTKLLDSVFTASDLYMEISNREGCPTFDEFLIVVENAVQKKYFTVVCQNSDSETKYVVRNLRSQNMFGSIMEVKNILLKNLGTPMTRKEIMNECNYTRKNYIKIIYQTLEAIGVIDEKKGRPVELSWNEKRDAFYKNGSLERNLNILIDKQKEFLALEEEYEKLLKMSDQNKGEKSQE